MQREGNGVSAIIFNGNAFGMFKTRHNFSHDGGGRLVARIIISNNDLVGIFFGNARHDGAFSSITFSATTKDTNQLTLFVGIQCF